MDITLDSPINFMGKLFWPSHEPLPALNMLLQGRLTEPLTMLVVHTLDAIFCGQSAGAGLLYIAAIGSPIAACPLATVCMAAGKYPADEAAADSRGRP